MKALSIIFALFFVSLFTFANPSILNSTQVVNNNNLPDLSQDKDFVKAAIEIYSIQTRIVETNSEGLMKQDANGTLTDAEKNTLAVNLGFNDYSALNNSINSLSNSILALKNKYAGLKDQATTASLINTSINKLAKEGKINVKATTTGVCFWQLLCAIFNCVHTSCGWAELRACLCEAYLDYKACVNNVPR